MILPWIRRLVVPTAIVFVTALSACGGGGSGGTSDVNDGADDAGDAAFTETCEENALLDASCAHGSGGTHGDNERALPLEPSVQRDVHMVEIAGRDSSDADMRSSGYFTRPHIPPYRTTSDGRIGMQLGTRASDPDSPIFQFYLFEPKKIERSFLSSDPSPQRGLTILSSREAFELPRSAFVDTADAGASVHSTICNNPDEAVTTCGPGGRNDCHRFSVIVPFENHDREQTEIWGTPVTVEVENPKTASSRIVDVRTGTPQKGAIWPNIRRVLETMITADGHFLAGRAENSPITYTDNQGNTISGSYDAIYSAYDPDEPPCDPNRFEQAYPISHMPYDDLLKQHWGVAAYPWTYPDGGPIPDGAELRATYPWLDSQGDNIFFGTSSRSAEHRLYYTDEGEVKSRFETRCVENRACDLDDGSFEGRHNRRAISVVGLWTQGRVVLVDNMLNNIDWGLGRRPSRQRSVRLFEDDPSIGDGESDGWVRLGSGDENSPDGSPFVIDGASGNINFIDSLENKFNHDANMKPNVPREVTWFISNGTVTDVVDFDDWIDPRYLIASTMVQAKSGKHFEPDFTRTQNAASGLYETPAYGQIEGPGAIERVALGGTRGKGLFLRPSSGLRYTIPGGQGRILSQDTWYLGVFVDPRMINDRMERTLLEFPDRSSIRLQGLHTIALVTPSGARYPHRLEQHLPFSRYSHLGFRIEPGGSRVEIFRDGMLVEDWLNPDGGTLLTTKPGDLWLGRASADERPESGFHGWVDDLKVIGQAEDMTSEEVCNHALGSLVVLGPGASAGLRKRARMFPAAFHDRIAREAASGGDLFLCYRENMNQDGWVDINVLPDDVASLREAVLFPEGPLQFDTVRPDSSANDFCLACHRGDGSDHRPPSLLVDALEPSGLLMQDDRRRQPLQPPAQVHGNIPPGAFGELPYGHIQVDPAVGQPVDEFISR